MFARSPPVNMARSGDAAQESSGGNEGRKCEMPNRRVSPRPAIGRAGTPRVSPSLQLGVPFSGNGEGASAWIADGPRLN